MVFIKGSGDLASLSGGVETITDTGNPYVLPTTGQGYDVFTSNIVAAGGTLDLRTALAATNWKGAQATSFKLPERDRLGT